MVPSDVTGKADAKEEESPELHINLSTPILKQRVSKSNDNDNNKVTITNFMSTIIVLSLQISK